jgi:DNA (cytosine-5)-methyltransferase 1
MNELALFAGAGGGILGGKLLGWRTRCAVEFASYPREVLLARQRDGFLEKFPIWDDVSTFDGTAWSGAIDIITGGFPCQDISSAGKGAGITGERSGLWKEFARIIGEVQPKFAFIENSPLLRSRGLEVVLQDLASLGYNARWCVLGAWQAGGSHKRDRIWILAYPNLRRDVQARLKERTAEGLSATGVSLENGIEYTTQRKPTAEPLLGRGIDDVANRVDRGRAIGNGQVPAVAALAWEILSKGLA